MTEESIFAAALAIGSPAERAAYLDRVCGTPALRREVDALLAAHTASNALDRPPADLARTGAYESEDDGPPAAAVGDRIGAYRLMEQIGEGGFGLVFVAEQSEPVRRKVALKVLKPGMDTKDVVARFEAERQALALMDHPNIARVLDAGSTPQGRPYFVMELVRGVPITEYCDAQKLAPRERLALFVKVCQAVQHAHQKGVIHRDIKPSNVLVTAIDGAAVPKVIDFGVAKAVGQQLTEKTIYTRFAQMIGTPLYMSPEQAEMSGVDVDTRADVYALGVLLYELLTGTTPFDRDRFRKAGFDEIRRIIREEEPPRPSTRLSSLGDTLTSVSTRRGIDSSRLVGLMRGELDWVVMKALEKDRNRRYDSATSLAKDVERFLGGDAVEACPPTLGYRLRKAYRRNRAAVLIGGSFGLVLLAATAVSSWLAVKASRAEELAEAKRSEAEAESEAREVALLELTERESRLKLAFAESAIDAFSMQIDLELAKADTDRRASLLRLVKASERSQGIEVPHFHKPIDVPAMVADRRLDGLRTFVAAAVLAGGQEFTPLWPPFGGAHIADVHATISPDCRTLLTFGTEGIARLWEFPSGKPIAELLRESELVVNCGFSTDGRTIFTDSWDGIARFWDSPSGAFRAQTAARPHRYSCPRGPSDRFQTRVAAKAAGERLMTFNIARYGTSHERVGPVELWDMRSGSRVARLDQPGDEIDEFQFLANGRWITTKTRESTVNVYSAADGRLVARLKHPPGVPLSLDGTQSSYARATADGSWLVTAYRKAGTGSRLDPAILQWWDAESWKPNPVQSVHLDPSLSDWQFVTATGIGIYDSSSDGHTFVYQRGRADPVAKLRFQVGDVGSCLRADPTSSTPSYEVHFRLGDEQILKTGPLTVDDHGGVVDTRSWQWLPPPNERRFHPDLARFAPDGRFVPTGGTYGLIDTRTDRGLSSSLIPELYLPGHGFFWPRDVSLWRGSTIAGASWEGWIQWGVVPTHRLDLDPVLLGLWAQVAVRGELGPDNSFVKWDEATWERKRQELAAKPAPFADFPFPGYVATDRLHWWRAEYDEATTDADKRRLAVELLRRAESIGDRAEAARWRDELERPLAPPPREAKK